VALAVALAPAVALAAGEALPTDDRFPAAGDAYVVAVNGRPVWARAPDLPLPPASLTKIMTALLVLERDWRPGEWMKVSARAAAATGSRLGLRAGDEITVGDAVTATLVSSANDACRALAEHAGGSEAGFVRRMNARARELGLASTRFENACGHDAPRHRSSARDLLRLAQVALANAEFRRTVAVQRAWVTTRGGRRLEVRTGNALLGRLDGARGVKSGYTSGAGRCLVGLAERDGTEVLVVLLRAPDRWWTSAALFEAAFEEARGR
jgi:D-alanyl-D-alanine carboxypeptidase (penicillin-binding protein 5/6)